MELIRNKRKKKKLYQKGITQEDALNIFTDGSCLMHDKRKGGVGVRFVYYDSNLNEYIIDPLFPGFKDTTNNEMELQACIEALKYAIKHALANSYSRIIIFSDSLYVKDNFSKAKYYWRQNDWKNYYGKPMANADQWKELVRLVIKIKKHVEIKKVKAHKHDPNNNAVDELAKKSAEEALRNPIQVKSIRRKKTKTKTEIGSVNIVGQRITIRIVSCKYERIHGLFNLKYEVVSKSSPYHGMTDIIFSNHPLRDGRSYFVIFNKEPRNPRVNKVIREIKKCT